MTDGVRAGSFAVILEDQHVAHPRIPLQVDDASHVSSDNVRDLVNFEFVQATVVSGGFHDDLVCTHAVHQIVEPFGASSQFALDPQSRIGIRDDPHRPPWPVGERARTTDSKYLRWCSSLVGFAKWTERRFPRESLEVKI